jgi:hypothetical protein
MSDLYPDRPRLCVFTFADGRRCRTPRLPNNPDYCYFHLCKEAAKIAKRKAADKIAFDLSGDFLAFRDVSASIAHTITALAHGDMNPKTGATIAYLCQTLVQSTVHAESEYIRTFGQRDWQRQVAYSLNASTPEKLEDLHRAEDAQEAAQAAKAAATTADHSSNQTSTLPAALPTSNPAADVPDPNSAPEPDPESTRDATPEPDQINQIN